MLHPENLKAKTCLKRKTINLCTRFLEARFQECSWNNVLAKAFKI